MARRPRPKLDKKPATFGPIIRELIKETSGSDYKFISSGCAVLDCVLGGGWALGRIANIVGDKCLAAGTIVSAARGMSRARKMTLQQLFNRVKGNHPNRNSESETFLVADVGGYAGMGKVLDVVISGEKTLYKITTANGLSIKASEDHKFATVEGWQCLSDNLSIGSMVKCWRGTREVLQKAQRNRDYRASTSGIVYHPFAWQNIAAGHNYKRLPTARLVIEATINDMSLPELIHILRTDPITAATLQYTDPNAHVHHLDGDPTNDSLDNLQLVSPEEHYDIHADEMTPNTKAIEAAEIIAISKCDKEITFDVTMEGPHHNFIANGFVVHNSTAKTALANEAITNFMLAYPKGKAAYRDIEAAFDQSYAKAMGLPVERVDFGPGIDTVEAFARDFEKFLDACIKAKQPGIYVLDSLDALSDEAEMEREIGKASYGMAKAKTLSEFFRKMARKTEQAEVLLLVVSQVRENIGVTFGEKYRRSGGKALDFYSSQILWLAALEPLKKTIKKVERRIGVVIGANCKKSKVGLPHRTCTFHFMFGFGVDDLEASVSWLKSVGRNAEADLRDDEVKEYLLGIPSMQQQEYDTERAKMAKLVKQVWPEIETSFLPNRTKYA